MFVIVGTVGLVLLIASIVIGDLLEFIGVGDGFVSGVAVGAALAIFGLAGVVTTVNSLPAVSTYLIAVAFALLALVVIQLFIRRIAHREVGGHYSPVGFLGVTTVSTSSVGGEVRLDDERELERRLAVSQVPLPAGARIRVVGEDGFRVRVVPADAVADTADVHSGPADPP